MTILFEPHNASRMGREAHEEDQLNEDSGFAIEVLLQELAELTGGRVNSHSAPILELQFGDITTKTSLSSNSPSSLLIVVVLPKQKNCICQPFFEQVTGTVGLAGNIELLWDCEEGRYILMREVPVVSLRDECSLLDAVLVTADQAKEWFESVRVSKSKVG